jgi:ketosteroid isomerase-like protein
LRAAHCRGHTGKPTGTIPRKTERRAEHAAQTQGDEMAAAESENERLVREFFSTLSTGDLEALRPLLHVDGSWEATGKSIPGAGITRGRDRIIDEFLAPVRGLFVPGDPKIKVLRVIAEGPWAAAETEAMGKLSNGKDYHNRYAWMIEIKDGKIFALREYMDTAYILEQLA